MILSLFPKRRPYVPLQAGEIVKMEIPSSKERVLYGRIAKISKKRNIFLHFVSKDKGDDLEVGTQGAIFALKTREVIGFPTKLLHRDKEVFIFAPPPKKQAISSVKLPPSPKQMVYSLSQSIEYRATASSHVQAAILKEISWDWIGLLANVPIPLGTTLSLNLAIPYLENQVQVQGKVLSCNPSEKDRKKHLVQVSYGEIFLEDKEELLRSILLLTPEWRDLL